MPRDFGVDSSSPFPLRALRADRQADRQTDRPKPTIQCHDYGGCDTTTHIIAITSARLLAPVLLTYAIR